MAYNGSGTFVRLRNWVADASAGVKIRADYHDSEDDGFAAALTNAITRDGQSPPSANLPMNAKQLLNLGTPTDPTNAATKAYVDAIKTFNTGISLPGAGSNNRLEYTAADMSFFVRSIGDPAAGDTTPRFIWNDKADGTGNDVMKLDDASNLTIVRKEEGAAAGPVVDLYRDSASPAASDVLGQIKFTGKDSSGAVTTYGALYAQIKDPVNASEDSTLYFQNMTGGTGQIRLALDNNGATVTGGVTCTGVSSAGAIVATTGHVSTPQVYMSSTNDVTIGPGGTGTVSIRPNGWSSTSGQSTFYSNGNLNVGYDLIATRNLHAGGGVNTGIIIGAGYTYMQFSGNWFWQWSQANGEITWIRNGAGGMRIPADGTFWIYNQAYKPGGGSWADSSDERIKNVLGEYETGLNAVKALRPVRFTFKGNDTPHEPEGEPLHLRNKMEAPANPDDIERTEPAVPYFNSSHHDAALSGQEFVGFVAQEVESVMPGMVTQRSGFIDGVEVSDIRDLDTTNLIFALVNAVRELSAKVEALEAAP